MRMFGFIRRYFRQVFLGLVALALCLFFAAHSITGERGLVSMARLRRELDDARQELESARRARAQLERRVSMLYAQRLDTDLLEESASRVLGYAQPGELVVFQ